MGWPEHEPASEEYDYVDPKKAHYNVAKLGDKYHILDVFNKYEPDKFRLSSYLFNPFYASTLFFMSIVVFNWRGKRPMWAQPWKHVLAIGGGFVVGDFIWKWNKSVAERKDSILKHYAELHPDDFPIVGKLHRTCIIFCINPDSSLISFQNESSTRTFSGLGTPCDKWSTLSRPIDYGICKAAT